MMDDDMQTRLAMLRELAHELLLGVGPRVEVRTSYKKNEPPEDPPIEPNSARVPRKPGPNDHQRAATLLKEIGIGT